MFGLRVGAVPSQPCCLDLHYKQPLVYCICCPQVLRLEKHLGLRENPTAPSLHRIFCLFVTLDNPENTGHGQLARTGVSLLVAHFNNSICICSF